MTPAARELIALLCFVVLAAGSIFWFLAYRDAARRARAAERRSELLMQVVDALLDGELTTAVDLLRGELGRVRPGVHILDLRSSRKKGPPPEAS